MNTRQPVLFRMERLSDWFAARENQIRIRVGGIAREKVTQIDVNQMAFNLAEAEKLEPIILNGEVTQGPPFQANPNGVSVIFEGQVLELRYYIPIYLQFSGDERLFSVDPEAGETNRMLYGKVEGFELLTIVEAAQTTARTTTLVEQRIAGIRNMVQEQETRINLLPERLKQVAIEEINKRRATIAKEDNLSGHIGLPIRKRPSPPPSGVQESQKRKIVITNTKPEIPELGEETYEDIIDTLRRMCRTIELSPSAFSGQSEENIRFQFLVPLNARFSIDVGGETFNFKGKTDILIRHSGDVLFAGECKFWNGPKSFVSAVTQILGYLTYRDGYASVLVFVKSQSILDVISKAEEALKAHEYFFGGFVKKSDHELRAIMRSDKEAKARVNLAVLFYHIPEKS